MVLVPKSDHNNEVDAQLYENFDDDEDACVPQGNDTYKDDSEQERWKDQQSYVFVRSFYILIIILNYINPFL